MGPYLPNSYPSLAFIPFISFNYSVLQAVIFEFNSASSSIDGMRDPEIPI